MPFTVFVKKEVKVKRLGLPDNGWRFQPFETLSRFVYTDTDVVVKVH